MFVTRATFSAATRCHLRSLPARVRASNCCFLTRHAKSGELVNAITRIYDTPPQLFQQPFKFERKDFFPLGYDPSLTSVSETKCMPERAPHFTADSVFTLNPKPKPEIFLSCVDKDDRQFFTAHSLAEDGTISFKYYFYPPSPINKDWFFTGHTYNGILHLEHKNWEHLLWNPTTNEIKMFPKTFDRLPRVIYHYEVCGMWSDHSCQDFKVLQFVNAVLEDEEGESIEDTYEIELYSLKTASWKKIQCRGVVDVNYRGVCINGVFYCLATLEGTFARVVLSFDFSTETMSTLHLPSYDSRPTFTRLIGYRGVLSVLLDWVAESGTWKHEFWVMEKEGSWTRESVFHTCGIWRPVSFSENGELLYFASSDDELVLFDRITGKLKHLGIYIWSDTVELVPFWGSSVRLSEISDVEVHNKIEQEAEEEEEDGYVIDALAGPMVQA